MKKLLLVLVLLSLNACGTATEQDKLCKFMRTCTAQESENE